MLLYKPIEEVIGQLIALLDKLSDEAYMRQSALLSGATIGQHLRHIIELFQCLETGYTSGVVNYEKRKRDYRIETGRDIASSLLCGILRGLKKPDKPLLLQAEEYTDTEELMQIPSNYYRELAYNLEHTIHHMALIRVVVQELTALELPGHFGVAYSTIKYRSVCAP